MAERWDRVPPLPPGELAPRVEYLAKAVLPRSHDLWEEIGAGYVFLGAELVTQENQASRAALALYDIDREARRAARIIVGRGPFDFAMSRSPFADAAVLERLAADARRATPRRLLSPIGTQQGGFELRRADPGSVEDILAAYGVLEVILLASPLQIAITLKSIFGAPTRAVLRRIAPDRELREEVDLSETLQFDGHDLRLVAPLHPGTRVKFSYKAPDGSELELIHESPSDD